MNGEVILGSKSPYGTTAKRQRETRRFINRGFSREVLALEEEGTSQLIADMYQQFPGVVEQSVRRIQKVDTREKREKHRSAVILDWAIQFLVSVCALLIRFYGIAHPRHVTTWKPFHMMGTFVKSIRSIPLNRGSIPLLSA